ANYEKMVSSPVRLTVGIKFFRSSLFTGVFYMLDRQAIRHTLIELLEADTGEKYPNLDDNTNLREGLGLDSVDVVSIISQIERRYRIRLTHQDLETLATVADLLNLLEKRLSEAAQAPPTGSEAPAA